MGSLNPDFSGDVVIVTGGTSGIGREICRRFGDAGAYVIVADIDETPKDADEPTAEAIRNEGSEAEFVRTDVTSYDEVERLVNRAREVGGVDVMVNNAGYIVAGSLFDVDMDDVDRIHEVNSRGVFVGTRLAAMDMCDRGVSGSIINTASISSNHAQFDQIQYDATKGAVRMITRGAALELAEYGIRVNAVAPGQIATEFIEGWSEEATEKAASNDLIKPVPLGRAGMPADVAGAYLYLASDDASYVTGELLSVDGGWQVF